MKKLIRDFLSLGMKDRLMFFLLCTTISNFIVAVVKFIFSITIPSLWFFINSIFSFILSLSRFNTVREYGKIRELKDDELKLKMEYKNYMKNGIILILLGVIYFFISSYMYYNGTNTNIHEYITYLVALIAFSSIGTAIYGMIKYKRNKEPIIKAVKLTNFANALTSIVLTQVVLLDTFAEEYNSSINGYTGMGVSFIITFLGLYMILGIKSFLKDE